MEDDYKMKQEDYNMTEDDYKMMQEDYNMMEEDYKMMHEDYNRMEYYCEERTRREGSGNV